MPEDRRLIFLLHRAQRAVAAHANARLFEGLGITSSQFAALHYVAKHEGCSTAEVAAVLDINKSAAGATVQRLERAGILRRSDNPADARGSCLFLTPYGKDVRAESMPVVRRVTAEVTSGFSEAEVETVLRFLNAAVERFGERND